MQNLMSNNKKNAAFTLVELLVVCIILSVVSLAIYGTLSNGVDIWSRLNSPIYDEDISIFFEKFTSDLRNAFDFENLAFAGTGDRLEFATFVDSPRLLSRTVGKVIYFYDASEQAIARQKLDYSQIYRDAMIKPSYGLKKVKSLKFTYYFFDDDNKEYLWQNEWQDKGLPEAVRIEIEIEEAGITNKLVRTVNVLYNSQS